jgi:hypothetical protein
MMLLADVLFGRGGSKMTNALSIESDYDGRLIVGRRLCVHRHKGALLARLLVPWFTNSSQLTSNGLCVFPSARRRHLEQSMPLRHLRNPQYQCPPSVLLQMRRVEPPAPPMAETMNCWVRIERERERRGDWVAAVANSWLWWIWGRCHLGNAYGGAFSPARRAHWLQR